MREWLTLREIADAGLPALPATRQGLMQIAERDRWSDVKSQDGVSLARLREGRGAGLEFHISLLPSVAKAEYVSRAERASPPAALDPLQGRGEVAVDEPKHVSLRDARLYVVARADDYRLQHDHLTAREADEGFAKLYMAGDQSVPAWVRRFVKKVSRPTIMRWRGIRAAGDLSKMGKRSGLGRNAIEALLEGAVATQIGAIIIKTPHLSAQHIRRIIDGQFGAQVELPDLRSFQRFVAQWREKNALVLLRLTNPDKFKSRARLSGSNSNAHVIALNQKWEIDASPADVMLKDGRYTIYVGIDIWSRRMKALVTKTARTEATLALVRRCILDWGVPKLIKTDNGTDFTSHRFFQALSSIGIEHEMSDAFSPEQKGTVERAIGTLQRGLMQVLPGFTGHNVAERTVLRERHAFSARLGIADEDLFKVEFTAEELQHEVDEWIRLVYEQEPHAGLDGVAPFNKALSFAGVIPRIENERALDLLLQPIGTRKATKQGIRLDGGWFISPYLLPGQTYMCRQDPEDMGLLFIFASEEGEYLTTAVCPERAGIDPKLALAAAQERQKEILDGKLVDERRSARKIGPRDMIDWIKAGAARKLGNVTAVNFRSSQYESAQLTAAQDAVADQLASPALQAPSPREREDSNVVQLPETDHHRFRRALDLEVRIEAGEQVPVEDAMWLGSYQNTSKYRSFKQMIEDFGAEAVLAEGPKS